MASDRINVHAVRSADCYDYVLLQSVFLFAIVIDIFNGIVYIATMYLIRWEVREYPAFIAHSQGFPQSLGYPKIDFIMENRIKMDDLGIPPFQETSYMIVEAYHTGHIHVLVRETSVLFCGFRHVSFPLNDFIFSRGVERLTSQFL